MVKFCLKRAYSDIAVWQCDCTEAEKMMKRGRERSVTQKTRVAAGSISLSHCSA